MNGRHILTHVSVVAVGLGLAGAVGVPMATALPMALVASCALMMLTLGSHARDHNQRGPRDEADRTAPLPQDRPHVHAP